MAVAVALATGCERSSPGSDAGAGLDADADRDGDVDAAADAAADAGADAAVDGGERVGMAGRSGTGTATVDGYAGTEEMFFISDEGRGEAVCRITYSLTSTGAPAEGCEGCSWAFELVIADASVAEERDVGCLATVGVDPARVEELDGSLVYYGFDPEYLGHGSALMSRMEGGLWAPETFASWDEASGAFSYRRVDGFPPY